MASEKRTPKRLGRLLPGQIVFDVDETLVRRLLAGQFPELAERPLELIGGWDNTTYRLGDDLAVRLPWGDWAVGTVETEHRWLPRLRPHLPLAIPEPVAMGEPAEGYPWSWSIFRWLDGEDADLDRLDPRQAAIDLARFMVALQSVDATDGPPPSHRGGPLAGFDGPHVRGAIAALRDHVDVDTVTATWDAALHAPAWNLPPVWVHTDLHAGNLLMLDGALSAVIDWGYPCVGDPACDLMVAWMFLGADTRYVLRDELCVDDATWSRGRGWSLIYSLPDPSDLTHADPRVAARSRATLARLGEIVSDFAS